MQKCMLNKVLEGFGYAATAATMEKVPAPSGTFFPDRTPINFFKHTFLLLR